MADSSVCVGSRCLCDGYYGTIHFIGAVPPTSGVWLGVEWDDPSRGKHSGEHEGVVYFKTRVSGSGSFVRLKKVFLGCTFMEAVRSKYGRTDDEEGGIMLGGQTVELVGMDKVARKQSEWSQLEEVSLRDMDVSSAGPRAEIATALPNLKRLNLDQSPLLPNWETVSDIASQLQHLDSLDLSEDRGLGHVPVDLMESLSASFLTLRTLYLNRVGISWNNLALILQAVPRLEAVHVCENNIASLRFEGDEKPYIPEGLQLLNLEKNCLSDWSDIVRLEPQLKKLKTLILTDNRLPSIFLEKKAFPELKSLSLSGNLISQWPSVTSLASVPSMLQLKLKDCPLLKDEPGFSARHLIIALLPHITTLNRSAISARERVLSERYYIKHYGAKWLDCKSDESAKKAFLLEHPLFLHLVDVHGLPDEVLMRQKPVTTALKHGLISVSVRCPGRPEQRSLDKKLPATMTVQKLKGVLQRVYRVDTSDQRLSYLDSRGDCEIQLDDDLKQLNFFSIESGDTILLRW
ncbi:tubulin-specific chaperone E-like [Halichondria panicea]|uniref:tubulin-specific chaperone E-like n=1 Tax=Halichondria panicea TaxID=6063 RepID=UPI00312B3365